MIHFITVFLFGFACLVWGYNFGFRDGQCIERVNNIRAKVLEIKRKVEAWCKNNNK